MYAHLCYSSLMYYSYLLSTIFLIVAVVIGVIGIFLIVVLALAMVKNVQKETKFHDACTLYV